MRLLFISLLSCVLLQMVGCTGSSETTVIEQATAEITDEQQDAMYDGEADDE